MIRIKLEYKRLQMCTIREIQGDLFTYHNNMIHCVSSDLEMSKGIALTFRNKFGQIDELSKQNRTVGSAPYIIHNGKIIYYLITKESYWQKPSIDSLILCLINMRSHMIANNINHISCPRIGCGLDGLNWIEVKQHIYNIFQNDPVTIDVYYL